MYMVSAPRCFSLSSHPSRVSQSTEQHHLRFGGIQQMHAFMLFKTLKGSY